MYLSRTRAVLSVYQTANKPGGFLLRDSDGYTLVFVETKQQR